MAISYSNYRGKSSRDFSVLSRNRLEKIQNATSYSDATYMGGIDSIKCWFHDFDKAKVCGAIFLLTHDKDGDEVIPAFKKIQAARVLKKLAIKPPDNFFNFTVSYDDCAEECSVEISSELLNIDVKVKYPPYEQITSAKSFIGHDLTDEFVGVPEHWITHYVNSLFQLCQEESIESFNKLLEQLENVQKMGMITRGSAFPVHCYYLPESNKCLLEVEGLMPPTPLKATPQDKLSELLCETSQKFGCKRPERREILTFLYKMKEFVAEDPSLKVNIKAMAQSTNGGWYEVEPTDVKTKFRAEVNLRYEISVAYDEFNIYPCICFQTDLIEVDDSMEVESVSSDKFTDPAGILDLDYTKTQPSPKEIDEFMTLNVKMYKNKNGEFVVEGLKKGLLERRNKLSLQDKESFCKDKGKFIDYVKYLSDSFSTCTTENSELYYKRPVDAKDNYDEFEPGYNALVTNLMTMEQRRKGERSLAILSPSSLQAKLMDSYHSSEDSSSSSSFNEESVSG